MIYDPDHPHEVAESPEPEEATVRNKIRYFLELNGPTLIDGENWWSLADIQEKIRGSSVRSRLQDIIREDIESGNLYYEVRWHKSEVGKAQYKVYRVGRVRPSQRTFF